MVCILPVVLHPSVIVLRPMGRRWTDSNHGLHGHGGYARQRFVIGMVGHANSSMPFTSGPLYVRVQEQLESQVAWSEGRLKKMEHENVSLIHENNKLRYLASWILAGGRYV